jgi:hypothetical protein
MTTVNKNLFTILPAFAFMLLFCACGNVDYSDETGQRTQAIGDGGAVDLAPPAPRITPMAWAHNGSSVGAIGNAFWDSTMNAKCQPMLGADGKTRCFPTVKGGGGIGPLAFFRDSSCTTKIGGFTSSACKAVGGYANMYFRVDTSDSLLSTCSGGTPVVSKIIKLGKAITTPSSVFALSSDKSTCNELARNPTMWCSIPFYCDWYEYSEEPLTGFADLTETH